MRIPNRRKKEKTNKILRPDASIGEFLKYHDYREQISEGH